MSKSKRPSGTLLKEQGSNDLEISLGGIKGLSKKALCIGADKAQIHLLFHPILFYIKYDK
jgi:hypothetical protein